MNLTKFNYKNKLIDYILIYALIFISSDSLVFATSSDGLSKLLILPLYTFIAFLFIRYSLAKKYYSKSAIIFAFISSFAITATALINLDFSFGYGYQLLVLISGFYISTRNVEILPIYEKISNSIIFLSFLSFPLYFIALLYPNFLDSLPKGTNQANLEYATYYVSSIFLDQKNIRNISIFREAGAFSVYLIFSLIYELFIRKEIKFTYLFIITTAILSTKSTAGYLSLIILYISFALNQNDNKRKITNINRKIIFLILIFIAYFTILLDENSNTFSKLSADSVDYGSTLARSASFFVNLEIFLLNPIWGVGLKEYQNLFSSISSYMYGLELSSESQSTNTFMSILSVYGIIPCTIYLISIFKFTNLISNSIFVKIFSFSALIFILASQDMRYSVLSSFIFCCGLLSSRKKLVSNY